MCQEITDLRSDTVTQPDSGMRRAMAQADVGDDVLGTDPTVEALQEEVAALLGHEASLFMPSGTMSNQIALRVHCKPGDEFLCEEGCHIYNYEQGAYAQLSGLAVRPIRGQRGVLTTRDLDGMVRPHNEHVVRTRLLTLENTHNRASGRVQPWDNLQEVCAWARSANLKCHLDGARLFNAVVASGISAETWAQPFDSVSICFSKGLGAPVGSALVGPRDFIREARWHRKAFGGGMRQVGILAAAARYALQHNISRLAEDHHKARILADAVRETPGLKLLDEDIQTNIVIFGLDRSEPFAEEFARRLHSKGIWVLTTSPRHVRMVTHLNVTMEQVRRAARILTELALTLSPATS